MPRSLTTDAQDSDYRELFRKYRGLLGVRIGLLRQEFLPDADGYEIVHVGPESSAPAPLTTNGSNGMNGSNGSNAMNGMDGSIGVNGSNGTDGSSGVNGSSAATPVPSKLRNGTQGSNGFLVASS